MAIPQPMPQQGSAGSAPDHGKMTHAEVHYRVSMSPDRRCDRCKMYYGKDDCEAVQSPIYPAGDCDIFASMGKSTNQMAAQPRAAGAAPASAASSVSAEPGAVPAAPPPDHLAHGRAIAGAKALHAVGHISPAERDKHIGKSQAALRKAGRKPFGSFAP